MTYCGGHLFFICLVNCNIKSVELISCFLRYYVFSAECTIGMVWGLMSANALTR